MSTSANRRLTLSAAVLLSGGCSFAPRYAKPAIDSPPSFKEAPSQVSPDGTVWKPAEPRDAQARGRWWEAFGDAKLDEFEDRLSSSNQSVASAAAAFLAARAVIAQARSQYFPSLAASPGVTRSHVGATPFGVSTNNSFTEYTLAFDASWQPDFWGKTRNQVAANVFAAQASAADLENVRLTAQAELAVDYYQLRAQDELAVLLDSAAAADGEALSLAGTLAEAGLDSDQPVSQARSQFEAARAQAVNARLLRAQYEHAIATLMGVPASSFTIAAAPFAPPPFSFPLGVPSQLLERRPDVASAERGVAQANAGVGVARAAYFPTLTLSASAGFDSFSAANWLSWSSRFWSLGASANETIFDGGARSAAVRQAKAVFEQAGANYRQTVLSAFQQVEDQLAGVAISSQDAVHQDAAVEAGRRNLEEARARYQSGLDPYSGVVAAQTALISLEQTALGFRIQRVVAGVQLIEALGGGWDSSSLPKPKELTRRSR